MNAHTALTRQGFPLTEQSLSRDVYALSENAQLVVYTDRLYAHGIPLPVLLPGKGILLHRISSFWMNKFAHLARNFVITADVDQFPAELRGHAAALCGRSLIARRFKPLPFQFLTVGSLGGEHWLEYQTGGVLRGHRLPRGLQEAERLEQSVVCPVPVNDPAKAGEGRKLAQRLLGQKLYASVEEICLSIFGVARNYAQARNLTLADAYFEFAMKDGSLYLMNEVLTPDTATYWPGDVEPGQSPLHFERQNLYSWLRVQRWSPAHPLPALPPELITATLPRYQLIADVMTGLVETEKRRYAAMPVYDEDPSERSAPLT